MSTDTLERRIGSRWLLYVSVAAVGVAMLSSSCLYHRFRERVGHS